METLYTSAGEYAVVGNPDYKTLYAMAEKCRGTRRRYVFEKEADLPEGFCSKFWKRKFASGKGSVRDVDAYEKIISHKAKESGVTMDAMLSANGMMPVKDLNRILFVLKPEKKDVQDLRKREYALSQYVHCDYQPDDWERYLKDLSFFAANVQPEEILIVKRNAQKLFEDRAAVRMLYKYRKHAEQRLPDMKANLKATEILDSSINLDTYYRDIIWKILYSLDKQ